MSMSSVARACLIGANRIFAPVDRLFGKRDAPGTAPLIIVGLPRSGTTLAYELIVQALDVAYFSKIYNYAFGLTNLVTRLHPPPDHRREARYESDYGRIEGRLAPAENHHFWRTWFDEDEDLGHYVAPGSLSAAREQAMNRQLASIGNIAGLPFVFKDVYLTLSINAVLEHVRDSKILVISRDVDAVAASMYRKRAADGGNADWWSLRPPFAASVYGRDVGEQVAFQCVRSRQILDRELSTADPARCRVVDYRDICAAPRQFVGDIANWLGPAFQQRPAATLPEAFKYRPSAGLPDPARETYAAAARRLEADRKDYLDGVDRHVAERRADPHAEGGIGKA